MKIRYIIYSLVCLLILSACSANQSTGNKIDPFSFIDQHEKPFGTDDLNGTVWIASFIFTNCNTVCPPMMFEMASLQKEIEENDLKVEFVSFTVDPNLDTPEVLRAYVQQFTNNETNWHMLTGYSQETIEEFAREQFQTIVQKPDTSNQVIHGTNFYLVDDQGYVLNEFNYIDESYVEEVIKKIKEIR
ncbi:SCO family protein [Gracilibacillus alcaliphilus]|uniref:SCO family protein n=1 Tax=Gracilibacillus alcaliphilus TaxID=1401441 RepID=UPI0019598233|nr:SCO family protein [Gracilibacillus alcaliphilus]MBM7678280.1 protein SCO1/2 [Gracilibacillus alcaliphilus]